MTEGLEILRKLSLLPSACTWILPRFKQSEDSHTGSAVVCRITIGVGEEEVQGVDVCVDAGVTL